jgi:hypothetical protein
MSKHQSKSTATPTCYNFSLQYKNKVELLHQKSEVYFFFFTPSPSILQPRREPISITSDQPNTKQAISPAQRDDVLVCLSSHLFPNFHQQPATSVTRWSKKILYLIAAAKRIRLSV